MLQRAIDVVVSACTIIILSPLLLLLAALVRATSAGPVLHRSVRAGKDGRPFTLLKFRSMRIGPAGDRLTRASDERITAVGRVLRAWKIDELPQLINVLRGDMTLVGPRPEDPVYVAHYTDDERRVLHVRPGLTGAASIAYRDEQALLTGDDWEQRYIDTIMRDKLRMDLDYLARRTVRSDLALLWKTLVAVLKH